MPGIEIKGRSKIANYRHGGRTGKFGGGRTNLLEQLGRVEAEPSNRNRRAEISRVHGELNRGYAAGGIAKIVGKKAVDWIKKNRRAITKELYSPEGKAKTQELTEKLKKGMGRPGHAEGGRAGFKRGKAVTKADIAKSDLERKRALKKRANIKRKSKWDIKGGIAAHPLNPFKVHAEAKSHEPWRKRSDVYTRTRDDLKKSQDPDVKGVAEGFQQMDYKDADKGTQFENREGLKKGGKADKKWIQKAVDPKHKGYCTPMT